MPPPTTSQSYGTAPDGADGPPCEPRPAAARPLSELEVEAARVWATELGRFYHAC